MMKKYLKFLFVLLFVISFTLTSLFFLGQKNFSYADGPDFLTLESNGEYSNINSYGNNLFASNKESGLVEIYNLSTKELTYTFDGKDTDDGKLVNASLTAIFGDNLYIYCSSEPNIYKIYVYNISTGEKLFCHNTFIYANTTKNLDKIVALTANSLGDIFAIGKCDENYIFLKKSNAETLFSATLAELTLDENSKILVSYSEEYIYVVTGTQIYKINSNTYEISQSYATTNNFINADIDKDDNIYLLEENTNFLTKLNSQNGYSTSTTITYSSANNISDFFVDVTNGNLYLLDNIVKAIHIENKQNIISNVSNFEEYNKTNNQANISQIEIAKVTKETVAYNFPYTISPHSTISEGQEVFIINKDYNFYLCLITNKENYNLYVYLNSKNLEIYAINNEAKNIVISTQNTPIYKLPSSLKAENGSQDTLRLDLNISSGDTFTAYRLINSPKDSNNKSFYEVKFNDENWGYIDSTSAYIAPTTNTPEEEKTPALQTNAYIINDNKNQVELYRLENGNFIKTGTLISSETRVQIDKETFDINSEYTEIKLIKDNEIITAYIKTTNIRVDGVKIEIIIASILCLLCVVLGIVLTVFIRKNKNKMR